MKYNVIGYFLTEGFSNVFKNKKSTISCLIVMCATMLIFGLFYVIGENINHMLNDLEASQAIRVFIVNEATDDEIATLKEELKKIDGINKITFVTQEEAYNEMKEKLGDQQSAMDTYEPSIFSASYVITLTDLSLNEAVQAQILKLDNVKRITSSNTTITALANVGRWIRIVTGALLVILIAISVFIIANTIKLTVHARRKEISIMKYVGATNGFIRVPFIIEGIVIGIIASIISILLVGVGYNFFADAIMKSPTAQKIGLDLLSFDKLFRQIILVYLGLGAGIGIVGSSISMRKYLDV